MSDNECILKLGRWEFVRKWQKSEGREFWEVTERVKGRAFK